MLSETNRTVMRQRNKHWKCFKRDAMIQFVNPQVRSNAPSVQSDMLSDMSSANSNATPEADDLSSTSHRTGKSDVEMGTRSSFVLISS